MQKRRIQKTSYPIPRCNGPTQGCQRYELFHLAKELFHLASRALKRDGNSRAGQAGVGSAANFSGIEPGCRCIRHNRASSSNVNVCVIVTAHPSTTTDIARSVSSLQGTMQAGSDPGMWVSLTPLI